MRNDKTKTIAKIAVLGAIAFILHFFDFPLPFVPSFYKIDLSEVAVLIGGFALGPKSAVAIEGLKVILKLLFKGTDTAYVGDIANFIIGCSLVVPATIIYHKDKTRHNAMKGLSVGGLCMALVGLVMNYFVLLPAYSYFYGLPMDTLIGMGTALIPAIKDKFTFVVLATTPFNIIKAFVVSVVTTLLYKHLSPILHR